ncbi:MAG: aldehyde dehydrogenase (NADP(+)) [Desulfuromonas sp.]|nr:MAG: aldehyde dehydrogenase (NADP(+)) [Desulfuromonas sp.]
MLVTGEIFINGQWLAGQGTSFQAVNPATGETLEPLLTGASAEQVGVAVAAAAAAALELKKLPLTQRAGFLRACAAEIMALGDGLVERAMAETALPRARIEGERARTCGQLNLFADVVLAGDFLEVRIDTALPERQPLPRPDLRSFNLPLGPVVVFGASNFPLAFSVAGGDTAAAFAAGCPVLVKGHPSHPGTSELVARALAAAAQKTGLPAGTFSLLTDSGHEVGRALVAAPAVKTVAFTGSFAGGTALVKLAGERPEPIPVFAEMGSLNPVVLLPQRLQADAEQVADAFVASLTMRVGQFCTNPGLVLGLAGPDLDRFIAAASAALAGQSAGVMLNAGIQQAYAAGVVAAGRQPGVTTQAVGEAAEGTLGCCCQPTLMSVSGADFIANPQLSHELFGPASIVVSCRDLAELKEAIAVLLGQLTGTIQGAPGELAAYSGLCDILGQRVGRLLINGFPTGVEVCHAMVHGGPFPATSDARFTSVGSAAIKRFLRPICLQNYPEELLPEPLRNSNPLKLRRLVNGEWTSAAL